MSIILLSSQILLLGCEILARGLGKCLYTRNDLLVGGSRIIDTEGIGGRGGVTVKGGAGNDGDLASNGKLGKCRGIHSRRKGTPDKQTALGTGVGDFLRHFGIKTIQHQIALVAINVADLFYVSVKVALGHKLVAEQLEQHIGVNVLALLGNDHFLHDLGRTNDKAYAHARRQDL